MVFSSLFQPLFRSPSVRRNFATVVSKEDLVRVVAERHDISLAETRRILSTIFDTVTDKLAAHNEVRLHGFGTFATYEAKERTARNPQTGETMSVPAKQRLRFRPSTSLKEAVEMGKKA